MEAQHILSSGIDTLNTIKEHILELNGCKEKKQELDYREMELENLIENKENFINDEITNTLKKRKEEVVVTINEQIEEVKSRLKKVKTKKDKHKNAKVSERIKTETEELEEENKKRKQMCRKLFKQNHIPKVCNTKLYYALYCPKYFVEFLILVITFIFTFLIIPCGIYYFFIIEKKIIYFAAIYFITILIVLGFYIFIYKISKGKHRDDIITGRELRNEIHKNNKKINAIRRDILKDKDESSYGLDKLNNEIENLLNSIEELEEQKKEILNGFENTTKLVISTEIRLKYEEEITKLKLEYDNTNKEIIKYGDKIKEMSLEMANRYEVYLGKEYMTIDKLDELSNIMTTRNVPTISAALSIAKEKV